MEENKKTNPPPIPWLAYEDVVVRLERTIKRLIIIIIVVISMLFASNAIWLYAWMQYDYVGEDYNYEYSQDGAGINIIGDRNGVINYEPETDSTEADEITNE